MNNIPSIGSSTELIEPKAQPKAQNFKGSKIKTLLTDELMFDSEFAMGYRILKMTFFNIN